MVDIYWKINRILKDRRNLVNSLVALVLIVFVIFSLSFNKSKYDDASNHLKVAKQNFQKRKSYSEWPQLSLNQIDQEYVQEICLNKKTQIKIENFDQVIQEWKESKNEKCDLLYEILTLIYDIQTHTSNMSMSNKLAQKVKEWLGNDQNLFEQALSQKLIVIYNRFTNEENVFNPLRQKRPQKKPDISPNDFYKQTMMETSKSCDFCSEDTTAFSSIGRLTSKHSYTASNLFPFDSPHELLLSRKHDLLTLTYPEFSDMLNMATEWFQRIYQKDSTLKYPVFLWDFMYKGGASQAHPHIHLTVNPDRYYSSFEAIRSGAEAYFKETNRNYFNDYSFLHTSLGLSYKHKDSLLIFSLTPKKDYDVIILSSSMNESIIELIYTILRTYMVSLNIYPFSMTIYYPSLDQTDLIGRIPLYVKIIPRGDISSIRSDISTLELMSTFNTNMDQFKLTKDFTNLLKSQLIKLN